MGKFLLAFAKQSVWCQYAR